MVPKKLDVLQIRLLSEDISISEDNNKIGGFVELLM